MAEKTENAEKTIRPERAVKRRFNFRALAIAEAVIVFILAALLLYIGVFREDDDDAVTADAKVQEEIRTRAVIEKEETFFQLSGKKIIMSFPGYGEVFLPVYEDVPACSIDTDDIVSRNGFCYLTEDGKEVSLAGIDVSEFQGNIDWEQVKSAGIDYAMIRIGYRGYGSGDIVLDSTAEQNLAAANAAGVPVGVYFYSQAVTTEEAMAEADAVLDLIMNYDIDYPVAYDWEIVTGDSARTDDISVDTLADCCVAFCERVKSAGYTPMIYQNKTVALLKLDLPRLKDYGFWLAEYDTKPTYYYDFQMWQYSSSGTVPGIEGTVDLNICFRDYTEEN